VSFDDKIIKMIWIIIRPIIRFISFSHFLRFKSGNIYIVFVCCTHAAVKTENNTTTGDTWFLECQMHSEKGQKHSGKPSPSATLEEEPPRMPFTGKRSSPSAKNRTLGEEFFLSPSACPRHSGKQFGCFL
jgi:hypothetical protein